MDIGVAISAAVTLVGIGTGYLGGVQKGKADLDVERERGSQRRDERDSVERARRREAYHGLLNNATRVEQMCADGEVRTPVLNEGLYALETSVNGIITSGAPGTSEPARDMLKGLQQYDFATKDPSAFEAARERFIAAVARDVDS